MQEREWAQMVFRVVGVATLVASLALFACSSDDDNTGTPATAPLNQVPVTVDANTAAILVARDMTLNNGAFLDARFGQNASTLTFIDTKTIALTTANGKATAPVTYGSCTFTYSGATFSTTFSATQGPQSNDPPKRFPGCIIKISSDVGIPVAGSITGTAVLSLTDANGNTVDFPPFSVSLSIDANGFLVVNGIVTTVKPAVLTGTGTGSGNQ